MSQSDFPPPVAIAVDIAGELALLQAALIAAEGACAMTAWLTESRTEAEAAEANRHDDYIGCSSRLNKLEDAALCLRAAVSGLGRAMLAPTTMTDEIPF
jgi:post-segregation antitoxin (ccd killing protein)